MNHLIRMLVLSGTTAALAGCGSKVAPATSVNGCTPSGFAMLVRPVDPFAVPDHNAIPPSNQESFVVGEGSETGLGCTSTNVYQYVHADWTTSDPKAVSISSADDATNGTATCLTATTGVTVSATLTAHGFTQTLSTPSLMVCK